VIKLVILDFDGTLADTRELIVRTNQEVQRRMGYPLKDEEAIAAVIGIPLKEGIQTMYPELPEACIPDWVATYRQVFEELREQVFPALFPHVKETLARLWSTGVVCSVASSRAAYSLNGFLQDLGIAPYISYVLGSDDVIKAKPHPEPVLKTLRELGFAASDTLVVGDMPVDIQMGLGAGAFTCGVTFGNSNRAALLASGAHAVIDDFGDLPMTINE
jgi:phosphoglycolate phosphatase